MFIAVLATIAVSCKKDEPGPEPKSNGDPVTQGGSFGPDSNLPDNSPSGVKVQDVKFSEDTFVPAPVGQDGWEPKPDSEIVLLGRQLDTALRDLRNGWARTIILVDDPKGKSQTFGEMKVQDRRHFNITYSLPRTEGSTNRLIGDGSMRALKDSATGFKRLGGFSEVRSAAVTGDTLENTLRDLPAVINRVYERDENVFEPLFRSLAGAGFDVTIEQKTMTVMEEVRPIVRLVATRKGGQPAELEFVIDEKRGLPVTMRTIVPAPGGVTKIMWTAEWGFGGTFESTEFTVPIPK